VDPAAEPLPGEQLVDDHERPADEAGAIAEGRADDPKVAGGQRQRPAVDALADRRQQYEGGFTGVLSVEHEDPVWGGTEDKVKTGLDIAYRTLRPLLVA
jgi:hypothetical protein